MLVTIIHMDDKSFIFKNENKPPPLSKKSLLCNIVKPMSLSNNSIFNSCYLIFVLSNFIDAEIRNHTFYRSLLIKSSLEEILKEIISNLLNWQFENWLF